MKLRIKTLLLIWFCLAFATTANFALAAEPTKIDTTLPGSYPSEVPGGIVGNFYQFALAIAGVLAFGAIVYGGVRYTFAAGNPSGQSEGKEWIKGALLGLLLLASAYLILNTINPKIIDLTLPTLKKIEKVEAPAGGGGITGQANEGVVRCTGTTSGQCPQGQTCVNRGSFGSSNYVCVSEESFDCGGKQFGDCPPRQSCVNVGGNTLETVRYECKT